MTKPCIALLAVLAMLFTAGPAFAQGRATGDAENIALAGRLPVGPSHAVCAVNDFVFYGSGSLLRIVDIDSPDNPAVVGEVTLPGPINAIAVAGDYAYVATDWDGLRIVHVSNPFDPAEVAFWQAPDTAHDVAVAGDRAYLACDRSGLFIIDIANPLAPTEAGSFDTADRAMGVAVSGNHAFVADRHEGLRAINVGDPAHPVEDDFIGTTGRALKVAIDGSYAYVAELYVGLRIVNISDPMNLMEVGLDTGGFSEDVALSTDGDYAYLAETNSILRIINITDPSNPTEEDSFFGEGTGRAVAASGVHAVLAADFAGLRVIDASLPATPVEVGVVEGWARWIDVEIQGDYAFCANDHRGLTVVNLSNPASPIIAENLASVEQARAIALQGDRAYIADHYEGLTIYNISDPLAPLLLGNWNNPGQAFGVAVEGDVAYLADGTGGLRIVDVSDPGSPSELGFFDTSDRCLDVELYGDFAIVADDVEGIRVIDVSTPGATTEVGFWDEYSSINALELRDDVAFLAGVGYLIVLDISTPSLPVEITHVRPEGTGWDLSIWNDLLFYANGEGGVEIYDITDVAAPVRAGYYDTGGEALGVAFDGENIVVTDDRGGLWVFQSDLTPVALNFFSALRIREDVRLSWELASQTRHRGFNLHRQEPGEERVRLNDALLSGRSVYEWLDRGAPRGAVDYWLQEVAADGEATWLRSLRVEPSTLPAPTLALGQNFPNPFNPKTTIPYFLPEAGPVRLCVFDLSGRRVATLVDNAQTAGSHIAEWDGRDRAGRNAASGVYLLRLSHRAGSEERKIHLAR